MHDFEKVIDRTRTHSIKWNPEFIRKWCDSSSPSPLSFWVADMDFLCAPPIINAVTKVAQEGIYGYSDIPETYFYAVIDWYKRKYSSSIKREWICYSNGIVPALNYLLQAVCQKGDVLLIQPPVYYPFAQSAQHNKLIIAENELLYSGNTYSIDFDNLEQIMLRQKPSVMFLCNPHNPVGKVWNQDELLKILELCKKYSVLLVSDEIHGDIVFAPNRFISVSAFSDYYDNIVVCSSPSKTFNIAGLMISNIIIPNENIRSAFNQILKRNSVLLPNAFAPAAALAAYTECDSWLQDLLVYLQGNIDAIKGFLEKSMPKTSLVNPEGTYLAWLDMEKEGYQFEEREELIKRKANVILDHGYIFGKPGQNFERINFACPRSILIEGLFSIERVLHTRGEV